MSAPKFQYKFNDFVLLPHQGILIHNGQTVPMTNRVFKVLELMVVKSGKVVMKNEFMEKVWADSYVDEGSLPVAINAIRKVLHQDGQKTVETFSRRGYRLNCQVEKSPVQEIVQKFLPIEKNKSFKTRILEILFLKLPLNLQKSSPDFKKKFLPNIYRLSNLLSPSNK
ncbi:MAG: winged helix-turn-helix domain-containing protein [Pyrinomonadaceae bacterium]|nr:winged helix-turn-helix domain-containing protein [Pyrinomonadaceae bacterium]